jgi:hypothetical protein
MLNPRLKLRKSVLIKKSKGKSERGEDGGRHRRLNIDFKMWFQNMRGKSGIKMGGGDMGDMNKVTSYAPEIGQSIGSTPPR